MEKTKQEIDITRFGNYLLSEERERTVKRRFFSADIKEGFEKDLESALRNVSHADFENWKEQNK